MPGMQQVVRSRLIRRYLSAMTEYACQAAIFELPRNREALDIMLDTMHVTAQDRELVPDALFTILALTFDRIRIFQPPSVEELLRPLDVLCKEAASRAAARLDESIL
jgi:hypothetical protein